MIALVLITGVGPFSTDTYLAALPELRDWLDTTTSGAQLTITMCIVGLAIGLLIGGSISDSIGRRTPLIVSTSAFFAASISATLANDITVLIICRLVQGVAAGAAASIGRAVVSDSHAGIDAARRFGTLAAIGLVAPVIAPAIGGVVITVTDWRGAFTLMGVLGALQISAVVFGVPETLDRAQSSGPQLSLPQRVRLMFRIPAFTSTVAVASLATAGFFVYIGGSSFVLQGHYGIGENLYSVVFAVNALGMAAASLGFRLLIGRVDAGKLRVVGLLASMIAASAALATTIIAGGNPPLPMVWTLLFVIVAGMGLTQPSTTVIAQEAGSAAPGTAASLQAGTAFLVGASATPLTGFIGASSVTILTALMSGFFAASVIVLLLTRKHTPRVGHNTA